MRILFTADWHLKLGQKNVPTEWARSRYYEFFRQLRQVDCDLHIIGGDLFDRLPSLQELDLYYDFLQLNNKETIIFSGNHEATKKNESFFPYLKNITSALNRNTEIILAPEQFLRYSILPYEYLHRKGEIEKLDSSLPVFTHVRGEIPPHVKPEVNLERFNKFPIIFAGDLHSYENCQRNIVYPGTPMPISFHREKSKYGGILIDSETWTHSRIYFDLPQLLKKKVESEEEIIPSDTEDHIVYELKGNLTTLSNVKDNELLVKKIVDRNDTLSVDLTNMSIDEELNSYLAEVLKLDERTIKEVIKTYHDTASTLEME